MWHALGRDLAVVLLGKHHYSFIPAKEHSLRFVLSPCIRKSDLFSLCPGILVEQFVPTGPHLQLYSPKTHSWTDLTSWHYSTIYLFFLLSGITDVVSHSPLKLPPGLDRLSLSLALLVEGESHLVLGEEGTQNKELLQCSWV